LDVKFVLRISVLLVAIAAMRIVEAGPPPLPEFVQEYIRLSDLEYTLPHGQLEPYTRSYLKEKGEPEPWAANADFNGDGVLDWAGLLRNTEARLDLVVVYSFRKFYSHEVLTSADFDSEEISAGVYNLPPGQYSGFPFDNRSPRPQITIEYPGIHLVWFEKASVLFYWNGSSFSDLITSD
jgi:hypothetical protein